MIEKIEEVWKPVINYEGFYEVSNTGKVRNKKRIKIISQSDHRQGYKLVSLYKNGKLKTFLVHRLVANAFIENPKNLKEINHIDENKSNNLVNNLEWCDRIYNANYGTANKRRILKRKENGNLGNHKTKNKGENNPNHKLSDKDVEYIRKTYKKNDKFFGGSALSKKFGVTKNYIYKIISNKKRSF